MLDEIFEGENCEIESLCFSSESPKYPFFQQHILFEGEIELLYLLHLMFPIHFAERIYDITYHISSSPYYIEDIHTKITPWYHSKES